MTSLLLYACLQGSPPLDFGEALAGVCEADVHLTEARRLPVFEGPAPELAVGITVFDGQVVVDGEEVALARLEQRLSEKAEAARALAASSGDPALGFRGAYLLEVDADAPAREVVPVLHAAHRAGFGEAVFVGRSAKTRPTPVYADPALVQAIRRAEQASPEERVRERDRVTDGILEACPPLMAELDAARAAKRTLGCDALADLLERVQPACPTADFPKIVTLFQYRPDVSPHVLTTRRQTQDPTVAPTVLEPSTTWGALVHGSADRPAAWWTLTP
jgi:biopolymer transport protein ExbD